MWRKVRPTRTAQEDEEHQRLLLIEELSRKQLARHLHDGPIQAVSALAMRANLAQRQLTSNPAAAADEIHHLEELSRSTARDLRYLQFTLIPQSLEGAGLDVALLDLARQHLELFGQTIQAEIDAHAARTLSKVQQGLLFHIAAEALDNARRHAQARNVHLRLSQPEAGVVLMEVEDDGVGFDPQSFDQTAGAHGKYGLIILRHRVKVLAAELHLRSSAGKGALLRVTLRVAGGKP